MRWLNKVARYGVLMMLVSAGGVLQAVTQEPQSIVKVIDQYLVDKNRQAGRDSVSVSGITLDSRLRLDECDAPLEPFLPLGGRQLGRVSVGVRCKSPQSWTLYVQAKVEWFMPVVVTLRPLIKGQLVGPDDVAVEQRDVAEMASGFFSSLDEVVGLSAARSLAVAMPLAPGMLKAPVIVRRGERVTILARAGALEVRTEGEALQDGAKGEKIRVRNLSSRQEIEGEVFSAGVVRVHP